MVRERPSAAARRTGYGIAAAINLVLLHLVNVDPGWDVLPFLTGATAGLIPLVNVSLAAGVAVNLAQIVHDPRWLVALGGMATTAIGAVVLVRWWQVFPFDFGGTSVDWALVARVVIAVALVGSLIGFAVQAVTLVTTLPRPLHRTS